MIEAARENGREALIADIGKELLQKLLSLKKGQKASIIMKRIGKSGGWTRFETTAVKRLKR